MAAVDARRAKILAHRVQSLYGGHDQGRRVEEHDRIAAYGDGDDDARARRQAECARWSVYRFQGATWRISFDRSGKSRRGVGLGGAIADLVARGCRGAADYGGHVAHGRHREVHQARVKFRESGNHAPKGELCNGPAKTLSRVLRRATQASPLQKPSRVAILSPSLHTKESE